MKRAWNWERGLNGSGMRFAEALGCISTEEYLQSVINLAGALDRGHEVRITAVRVKVDPSTGEPLDDHQMPGDYITVGYRFSTELDEKTGENWAIDRASNYEGEQAAADLAHALGLHTDREFCETMVQVKTALDRFGGQAFVRSYVSQELEVPQVVGYACQYEHLVRGAGAEPDSQAPAQPDPEPDPEPAESDPSAERDEIEDEAAELAGAEAG